MLVPIYSCKAVWECIYAENCEIVPYDIDDNFLPVSADKDTPILYANYFGLCGKQSDYVISRYEYVIMDNAQAFYARPRGNAAIYSPRKFFPLPDGGMLWPKLPLPEDMAMDESWDRCAHLLKRADLGPEAAYADFVRNENRLGDLPVRKMSRLTAALLEHMDVVNARETRLENFHYLHGALADSNLLRLDLAGDDVPLVYPYRCHDAGLRARLLANRIYVAKYWPEDDKTACMKSPAAKVLADSVIPLPIDQRYTIRDMERILEVMHV